MRCRLTSESLVVWALKFRIRVHEDLARTPARTS